MTRLLLIITFLASILVVNTDAFAQKAPNNTESPIENPTEKPTEKPDTDGGGTEGEGDGPIVRDGIYDKIAIKEKKILKYDHLREADIFWQKRVWRVIDTRQKMNLPFVYPEKPFISILLETLEKTEDPKIFLDDQFKEQITKNDLDAQLNAVDTITTVDPETYEEVTKIIKNDFDWTSVTKFRLKEDWVFDEETSTMIVRILAIAPIRDVIDDNGNYRGQQAMFYAYYPDFREQLVHYEVINPENDAMRLTWEDLFEMRYFSSYIMKESNIHDRRIQEYSAGKDALIESERIKQEIFQTEHDLWSY